MAFSTRTLQKSRGTCKIIEGKIMGKASMILPDWHFWIQPRVPSEHNGPIP